MNPWRGLRGLPRPMWALALGTLINRMGTMVMFFLALFLVQGRGWTEGEAATALALYGAGALAASPFSGWLADRYGHRRVLVLSLVLSAGLMLLLPYLVHRGAMLACITLWSAALQGYWPSSMALITDLVAPGQRKQAFVLHRLASNLGVSVGPALGGLIAAHSYPAVFWLDALTTFLGVGVILAWVRPGAAPAAPAEAGRTAWRNPRLLRLLLALLPATLAFTQIHGAFPLYVCVDRGHGTAVFGLFFTFNTLLILLFEVAVNERLARWTHGAQLAAGALCIGAGFGALGLVGSLGLIAAATAVWTLGEMIYLPASTDAVAAMAPPDRRGQYLGFYSLTWTFALTAGPWLGLHAHAWGGPRLVFGACAVLGAAGAALLRGFRE